MSAHPPASIRSWIVPLLVAVGHAIVLLLVVADHSRTPGALAPDWPKGIELRLIKTLPVQQLARPQRSTPRSSASQLPFFRLPDQLALKSAATEAVMPHIDWDREAERAGRSGASLLAPKDRNCEDAPRPGSMLPRCTHPGRKFEWNPEPKKIEFSGGLPYVHVGKLCVIGLGFFGCGIGDPPAPNGHLFDRMRDPDRAKDPVTDAGH